MFNRRAEDTRRSARPRLPSKPVRLSKEELAGSRAGTLGCFPSPELYEPEEAPAEERLSPSKTRRHSETHANGGN